MKSVYCEVQTGSLDKTVYASYLQGQIILAWGGAKLFGYDRYHTARNWTFKNAHHLSSMGVAESEWAQLANPLTIQIIPNYPKCGGSNLH